MNIYVIDNEPIYFLGLKQYILQLDIGKHQIAKSNSVTTIQTEQLVKADYIFIYLELFDEGFAAQYRRIKDFNTQVKLFGLVNYEKIETLKSIEINLFDALIIRSTIIDELRLMFSFERENRKYYSPEIIEYFNNNIINIKNFQYE